MATFPTSADFERPVPRVERRSPGIATYRTEAGPAPSNAGADAAFAQGQQTIDLGKEMDRFGAMLDETSAQDALNQLRLKRQELTLDPEKGFQRIKGGAVLQRGAGGKPWTEEWSGQFQTAADEIGGKLLSPRAKAMFRQAAGRESMAYKRDLAVHLAGESERYEAAVYKDTQTNVLNEAITADPDKLDALIGRAESAARNRATQLGLPPEAAMATARSDVVSSAIKAKLAANDPGALTLFNLYRDRLDAKDRVMLETQVKTMGVEVNARAQAQSFTDPTYDGRTRSYESGAMEFNKLGSGAFGPYQFMPGTWAEIRKANPDLNLPADMTMPGATDEERRRAHDAAHDRFKAANAASLKADGLEATPANLYLAHRFGAKGAASVLKANANAPLSSVLPPEWQAQNPDMRGQTAGSFRALAERRYAGVTDTGIKVDPLTASVNQATGVEPPKNGPLYRDTRQMLLDADIAYDAATRRNMEVNATNEAQRRATQSQIDINLAAQKRQIEMAKLNLEIAVDKWMTTGGPNGTSATQRPPPEIWNQLPYEKQKSIDATIAHNAKGQDAITDQQTWYTIQQGLTSADPAVRGEWANKPLWEFKSKLSNQDFQELAKMQGVARKGDPEKQLTHVRNINQLVDDTLLRMKVDTTPKPGSTDAERAQKFRRAVQERITLLEAEKSKKSTPEEQQKIIDALALEVRGTGGWFSSNKRRYDMKIDDVPQAERNKIVDALKRAGHTATDDMIIDLFARKNAVPAR